MKPVPIETERGGREITEHYNPELGVHRAGIRGAATRAQNPAHPLSRFISDNPNPYEERSVFDGPPPKPKATVMQPQQEGEAAWQSTVDKWRREKERGGSGSQQRLGFLEASTGYGIAQPPKSLGFGKPEMVEWASTSPKITGNPRREPSIARWGER